MELGYRNGHALQLDPPEDVKNKPIIKVVVEPFTNVSFPRAVISMRNGNYPYAWAETVDINENCNRLFIECL